MIPAVLPTYSRAPLHFVKGEGSWLIEADGRRFLDLGAGIAVNALGHANPKLVKALTDQAEQLWHVSNLYQIGQQETLAQNFGAPRQDERCLAPFYLPACRCPTSLNDGLTA